MASAASSTELDILAQVVQPDESGLDVAHARFLLQMRFAEEAQQQIRSLLQKNNRGEITAVERELLDRYLRVGQFIDLLHAKARLTLKLGDKA